jgi:hypothetical protein
MSWWLGIGGALFLGFLTNLIYDFAKHGRSRITLNLRPSDRLSTQAREHDFESDGLFMLITWSRARPLWPRRLVTGYQGRPRRDHLFDTDAWRAEVIRHEESGAYGSTAYISRLTVDHGEHRDAQVCEVDLAESTYAECLATKTLAESDLAAGALVRQTLGDGLDAFIARVPPTMVSAGISVVDRNGRLLLLRRSLAVRTFQAQWTVGINESMKYNDEPGAAEDFFALIERGLQEVLGLLPGDYAQPVVSWLGWSVPASCFCLFAAVRAHLDSAEIDARREASHSVYEHDMVHWLPLNARTISAIITGGLCPDGSLRWSYLAPLAALELWRTRTYL